MTPKTAAPVASNSSRGNRTQTERRILDARVELATEAEIRALQVQKLREVLRFVDSTNSFYRDVWRAAAVDVSDIDSIEEFAAKVPTVEKADFVSDQAAAPPFGRRLDRARTLGERLDVYTTSGTSGQGVEVHAQTARELRQSCALYEFGFRWAGLVPGDTALLTLPLTMMAGGRMELAGAAQYGLTTYPAGAYKADEKLALLERFRPKALYGSTSYFGHLASIHPSPEDAGVEVLLTGLEGVGLAYLSQLEQRWQARAFDRFGATQVRTDWMFTCEHGIGSTERPGLLHNLDPWVLLEVVDPDTGQHVAAGEVGELVVTSLYHFDTPVVRCRLKDQGVYQPAAYCGCGRPFGGVQVASIGRTDDVIKIKGVNVFPEAVDDLLYSLDEVDEYQVTVTSSDTDTDVATIAVMPRNELPEPAGFVSDVTALLRERIGISFVVELSEGLPRSEYKARRWHDRRDRH
jgi:phenylacetate-CoA ligase